MRMPTRMTIELPSFRLRLHVFGGDWLRLTSLFQSTWRRMPLFARRGILRHWRTSSDTAWSAAVVYGDFGEEFIGQCGAVGRKLRFNSADLDTMPEEAAQVCIARELIHVWQRAEGRIYGSVEEMEVEVDELLNLGGFEADALDQWEEERRKIRWAANPQVELEHLEALRNQCRSDRSKNVFDAQIAKVREKMSRTATALG